MKKIIPLLLILMGIILILAPTISEQILKFHTKQIVTNEISNEIIRHNNTLETDVEFDYSAVEDFDILTLLKGSLEIDKNLIIGTLIIPDLDMNLPIMRGLTDSNLMIGAATMKADQTFGQGNYTLAGHYTKNKDLLFGSLMDIELENKVYISDGESIFEYEIYDTLVALDTEIEILSDERSKDVGKPIVSLMTCYFSSSTGKRFFALGKLIDQYSID